MHDLRMVRDQIDALREGMRRRGALDKLAPMIDRAVGLDQNRRETIQAVEERKAERNAASRKIAQLKRGGAADGVEENQKRSRELGEEIARLDSELAETEKSLNAILLDLPNVTLDVVPEE